MPTELDVAFPTLSEPDLAALQPSLGVSTGSTSQTT
jgi:hypothetical protein